MTTATPTPQPGVDDTEPEGTAAATTVPEPDETPEKERRQKNPNAEAAARRTQLRDVEAERDSLLAQRSNDRRQLVENLLDSETDLRGDGSAPKRLNKTADLWEFLKGTPDQFYDDEGNLDKTALADFIDAGTEDRDYLLKPARYTGMSAAQATASMAPRGGLANMATGAPTWGNALNPRQP
ncbi:hypothetical protein GCM10025867_39850 [Frondihabitans sucicola]|uniref:Uncharacterized protein n=1 Tax=Frondihabitans sucicola TaxID=1268041 RepID=A0ABN6Y3U0_9MICO|nr:hypothetical protein [Frondihabitans sucicola]BDZ51744.1 hypothetical protein GCM10025867_39850 [Frondihabitans sucicola]